MIKLVMGLGLLVAIAFGSGAAAAQHGASTTLQKSETNGAPVIALAAMSVGVFGLQRRKG